LGILKLAAVLPLISHAAAGIHQQIRLEVCLFLVFLDVIAVSLAQHAPIDVADFIAGIILPMLGELDAEALIWALVHAGEKALHDRARHHRQPAVFGQRRRIKV
jgi:hypothetical protein